MCAPCVCAERGVLMHAAQVLKGAPTRDVYVVRDNDGDREFAGFGRPTESYSDCFLDANSIPAEEISVGPHRLGAGRTSAGHQDAQGTGECWCWGQA